MTAYAHVFPSRTARTIIQSSSGASALTYIFPSCPGETSDAICPLSM
jgi:hypothetical protein